MKALVTGGGGFLGGEIVRQLVARGDSVRVLARQRYAWHEPLGVEACVGDVRDAAAVRRACVGREVVFHTAAVAGIWGSWEWFHGINTAGTHHVLEACRAEGVPYLVQTSSPSVTFDGSDQTGVDECVSYPSGWLCHYAQTKALAEQAVLAAHGVDGLATCALRPHLIWGPDDPHLVPRLLDRARQGRLVQVGAGRNRIDTIYVENAAAAHLQALEALHNHGTPGGRAYFISQGEPVNCWGWINELLALAGLPPVRRRLPLPAAWAIGAGLEGCYWGLGWQQEPRMTRFLAAQLARDHFYDIGAARRDFGFQPRVSQQEGMRRLAAHWSAGG